MRTQIGIVAFGLMTAFAAGSGCRNRAGDCALNGECCPDGTYSCSEATGGGGTGGAGGGTPVGCVPSAMNVPEDSCGVFVDPNASEGGTGTKDSPVQTITEAVGMLGADKTRIYACAAAFAEDVTLPGGTELYGGLDCAKQWGYVGDMTKTTITASTAGKVPLTLEAGMATKVSDIHAVALDGSAPGESSIAVVANEVAAEITGCVFEAGKGVDGVLGEGYTSAAQSGAMGMVGGEACTANTVVGADAVSTRCGATDSTSGLGGNGSIASGGSGSPGLPDGAMNGGAGEGMSICTPGTKGDDGMPGMPGAGATGLGTIAKAGYTGALGLNGMTAAPAQGGGGGGGAKGGSGAGLCPGATTGGAAGGSGGSGGCGGAGGRPGTAGGSSIALLSLSSSIAFTAVTLQSGDGGTGGDGGLGQDGGPGGFPGAGGGVPVGANNLNTACSGGDGGKGGKGGLGGGGRGGHSIGIAYRGAAVPSTEGVTFMKGMPGNGGMGADANGNGAPGAQVDVQVFE